MDNVNRGVSIKIIKLRLNTTINCSSLMSCSSWTIPTWVMVLMTDMGDAK